MDAVKSEEKKETTYPTTPDANGYFFNSEEEFSLDIKTKEYPNGSQIKEVVLPKSKKVAVIRELKAKDSEKIAAICGDDSAKYQKAVITLATKIDNASVVIEEIDEMSLSDYTRLQAANAFINFM